MSFPSIPVKRQTLFYYIFHALVRSRQARTSVHEVFRFLQANYPDERSTERELLVKELFEKENLFAVRLSTESPRVAFHPNRK